MHRHAPRAPRREVVRVGHRVAGLALPVGFCRARPAAFFYAKPRLAKESYFKTFIPPDIYSSPVGRAQVFVFPGAGSGCGSPKTCRAKAPPAEPSRGSTIPR